MNSGFQSYVRSGLYKTLRGPSNPVLRAGALVVNSVLISVSEPSSVVTATSLLGWLVGVLYWVSCSNFV